MKTHVYERFKSLAVDKYLVNKLLLYQLSVCILRLFLVQPKLYKQIGPHQYEVVEYNYNQNGIFYDI